jgi:hypothetical protein
MCELVVDCWVWGVGCGGLVVGVWLWGVPATCDLHTQHPTTHTQQPTPNTQQKK